MLKILKKFSTRSEVILAVKKFWNINVSKYNHVIDQDGINHINFRHGPKSREKKENIITEEDIESIETIVKNPNEIISGGLSGKRKLPTIVYI